MVSDFSVLPSPFDIIYIYTLQLQEMWEMMVYTEAEVKDETDCEFCTRAMPHPKLDTNEMEKMCLILHEISLCRVLIKSAMQKHTKQWAIQHTHNSRMLFDSEFCLSRENFFFVPVAVLCCVERFRVSISLMRIRAEPSECCSRKYIFARGFFFLRWSLLSVFIENIFSASLNRIGSLLFFMIDQGPRRHEQRSKKPATAVTSGRFLLVKFRILFASFPFGMRNVLCFLHEMPTNGDDDIFMAAHLLRKNCKVCIHTQFILFDLR